MLNENNKKRRVVDLRPIGADEGWAKEEQDAIEAGKNLEVDIAIELQSWPGGADDRCIFRAVVTLDPSKVVSAWDRLSEDTWALEFESIPHVMHWALLNTLKERRWAK